MPSLFNYKLYILKRIKTNRNILEYTSHTMTKELYSHILLKAKRKENI